MTREVLQQALEALEETAVVMKQYIDNGYVAIRLGFVRNAITTIKAALKQPEPEPLEYWNAVEGWVKIDDVREHFDSVGCGTIYKTAGEDRVPLYTSPQRKWVGIEAEDLAEIDSDKFWSSGNHMAIAMAVEAKLKEKNNG
jgi:hypothetical protein